MPQNGLPRAASAAVRPSDPQGYEPLPGSAPNEAGGETLVDAGRPMVDDDDMGPERRIARRRPAGPSRGRAAANDDGPSIGGLIYSLQQKPSDKPYRYAALASGIWTAIWAVFSGLMLAPDLSAGLPLGELLAKPTTFLIVTAIAIPVSVFWFLAMLAWRSEELQLRSQTMTEVAVRLAEPDRMAEQSVASLGQAVRRQVSYMNDAVSRALGRAGELEALVHNEVSALERSYEENERKIRGLIQELSGERHALLNTSERVSDTLRGLGTEIPALIEKLSTQQVTLARIIQDAGQNLTQLESAITHTTAGLETSVDTSTRKLETTLGGHATRLQSVLEDYTTGLGVALNVRTQQMQSAFEQHARLLDDTLGGRTQALERTIEATATRVEGAMASSAERLEGSLASGALRLEGSLDSRARAIEASFEHNLQAIDSSLGARTDTLKTVFEEYGRALDTTIATRAQAFDTRLVERTQALDDAFSERLRLFDESILRSTMAIDGAVGERSRALTEALESHARTLGETLSRQAVDLDETLMQGIGAVRRTSESITRQSIKAIEGLASQSELLKSISENLLGQINTVTGRFEQQGQHIMRAAGQLEQANYKIDTTLQTRHAELNRTLDRLSTKADEYGEFVQGYSSSIAGSINDAEQRARLLTDELRQSTESRSRSTLEEIERLTTATDTRTQRALDDLRTRVSSVQTEVSQHLGSLTNRFEETSEEVRSRAAQAAEALAVEQAKLKAEVERLPQTTQESAQAMRRGLQDQLRALEQLAQITGREAVRRDVAPPTGPSPSLAGAYAAAGGATASEPRARGLSSLASLGGEPRAPSPTAARALAGLPSPPGTAAPSQPIQPQVAPQSSAAANVSATVHAREAWKLGDLLARASLDEDVGGEPLAQQSAQQAPQMQAQPAAFDIDAAARALDAPTAAAIWSRIRSGQRGVMVRSIYSPEGRATFDEAARRYGTEAAFQGMVNRYLSDFERILGETDQKDPSGRAGQGYLVSESGRIYLVLAHAAGRI